MTRRAPHSQKQRPQLPVIQTGVVPCCRIPRHQDEQPPWDRWRAVQMPNLNLISPQSKHFAALRSGSPALDTCPLPMLPKTEPPHSPGRRPRLTLIDACLVAPLMRDHMPDQTPIVRRISRRRGVCRSIQTTSRTTGALPAMTCGRWRSVGAITEFKPARFKSCRTKPRSQARPSSSACTGPDCQKLR